MFCLPKTAWPPTLYASARVLKLLREVKAIVGQELLAGPRTTDRSCGMPKDSSWSI